MTQKSWKLHESTTRNSWLKLWEFFQEEKHGSVVPVSQILSLWRKYFWKRNFKRSFMLIFFPVKINLLSNYSNPLSYYCQNFRKLHCDELFLSGERPIAIKLTLVPALGESFAQWAVDIPWISRVKTASCMIKCAMYFLICSSTSSWVRMRVADWMSPLLFGAVMKGLVYELPFSLILSFEETPLTENRCSFKLLTMVNEFDFHPADENRWNPKIDIAVNTEDFHHMHENRWAVKYLIQLCMLFILVRYKPMNFIFEIDPFSHVV